jgi:hypothetical protein
VVGRNVAKQGVTLSTPNDPYEQEADAVADKVVQALHSGSGGGDHVSRSKEGSKSTLPTVSLAQAIIQRKVSGIPDIQMDIGVTLGVIGVAVSAGAWVASGDSSKTAAVSPNMEWIAARGEERNRYRAANPWRTARVAVIPKYRLGTSEYYGCNLTYRYNGAEIVDIRLEDYYKTMWGSSSHTQARVFDDQSQTGRLGIRCDARWDPWGPGDFATGEGDGWIGVDGSFNAGAPRWSRA